MGAMKFMMLEEDEKWSTPNQPDNPRSPIPEATRRAVMERCDRQCERCGENTPLELHHRHYNSQGKEEPEDLWALCRDCHEYMHRDILGEFWVDPVAMSEHWGVSDLQIKWDGWDLDDLPGWRD